MHIGQQKSESATWAGEGFIVVTLKNTSLTPVFSARQALALLVRAPGMRSFAVIASLA
jgi:hypothetical protein